ncbi:DUF4328 domain-containing protein [Streptomyces sp. NPDC052396]|uniref:protein kinase domain-containing protein n=1 Tax=Streptomyces sp. NPDC052396 TaxID=3365689 RepID=UPI0037CDC68B
MSPIEPPEPQWVGRYRVLRKLGEGGMGQVYLARSEGGRTVAVKVIRPEVAHEPEFRRRFRLEVEAARKVGAAWTAPVLDADTEAAVPWVATGYVAGPSLHTVITEDYGPLPGHSLRALAHGLALALRDIHGAGLVHRDLKPSNVLVTVDGPRVIDFGIARALHPVPDGPATRTGAVLGSPGFMSPEQVRGRRVTSASDVFCYGAVLAFAATGRMPFGTPDSGLHALMFRVAEEEPDLSGLADGPLRELIVRCLAKDPGRRPDIAALVESTHYDAAAAGPWLPGEVLAGLGRHAAELLDAESPAAAVVPTARLVPATVPAAAVPVAGRGAPMPVPVPVPAPGPASVPGFGPPPEPAGPREEPVLTESPRGMAIALQALLAVLALVMLGYLALQVRLGYTLTHVIAVEADYPAAQADRAQSRFTKLEVLQGLLMVPVIVMWLLWFWRVRINAEAFAPGRQRFRRGWALGGWFTPVASLWIPKLVTDDIWAASDPDGGSPRRASRGVLNAWWVFWVVELIFGLLNFTFSGQAAWYDTDDPAESRLLLIPEVLDNLLMIAACGFAFAVVRRLTALQVRMRAAGAAPAPGRR